MSAQAPERVETPENTDDNPTRMLHLLCGRCYPVLPAPGTPAVRWCGAVVTIKDDGPGIPGDVVPPDACVVCANLARCSTCGAVAL